MIGSIASAILGMPPALALALVFALPALESSMFVGFVFPGEIALILGGVLAFQGSVSLAAVLAAGIIGAAMGDSIGYAVGRRYGGRILTGTLGRFVKEDHLVRGQQYLVRRGPAAVFLGRFTVALRVVVPGLAGMSGMRYRSFAFFNITSALAWGTLMVLLGYLGGASWQHAQHLASLTGLGVLAVLVAVFLGPPVFRRVRRRRATR